MEPNAAADVRSLAAWLQARRELSERVEVMLVHGPTAVQRVRRHLEEVRSAYARELAAFEAFASGRGAPPGSRGPDVRPRPAPLAEVDLAVLEGALAAATGSTTDHDRPADPSADAWSDGAAEHVVEYPPLRSVVLPP